MTGRDYLAAHGIDLSVAADCGVGCSGSTISYAYGRTDGGTFERTRHLDGKLAGKTLQPHGEPLCLYWPADRRGGAVLLAEGESDALAALTALRDADRPPPVLDGLSVAAVPGVGMPAERATEELKQAGAEVVYLAFDGDDPGRKGAARLVEALTSAGVASVVVPMPDGEDVSSVLAVADDPVEALAGLLAEAEAEPQQEVADEKLDLAGLLDSVGETLDRYVVLPGPHERLALQLFVAHTWAIDGAHATPYILIVSPEKRSGKTRLRETLELLLARPWGVVSVSEAAMFRKIANERPTLLLDEIDAIFKESTERTESLRAILNAGNRPGASVARCINHGSEVEDFPVFCAKVLAGIDSGHRIPDTIRDRSIAIHMQRKTGTEPVERFRPRYAEAETGPIREQFERWAESVVDHLLAADPFLPPELDDRAADAWEPLFAIADMAGGAWAGRARRAALALSGGEDREETTTGTLLLGAIRSAFRNDDRMASADLLNVVNAEEELPFGGWREGRGLDGRLLARLLKPYGIKPRPINLGGDARAKGYLREQFEEAWARWLASPDPSVTAGTSVTATDAVTGRAALESQSNRVTGVTDLPTLAGMRAMGLDPIPEEGWRR